MTNTPEPNPSDDPNKDDNAEPPKPAETNGTGEPNLMAEFLESKFAVKTRGFLNPYAAHVVFMTRMTGSSRTTAAFFAEKLQRKISRRPVEDVLNKVRRGEIVITSDQLAAVAREHPTARRYAELNPEILDPTAAGGKPAKKTAAKEPVAEKATVKKAVKKIATKKIATKKAPAKKPKLKKVVSKKVMVKKAAKKSGKAAMQVAKKKPGRPPRRDPGPELPGLDS
jgi:hypothetical protein